jgi:hypothetical protein
MLLSPLRLFRLAERHAAISLPLSITIHSFRQRRLLALIIFIPFSLIDEDAYMP